MRCKACNVVLTDDELRKIDKLTGDYTELCGYCEDSSNAALYFEDDNEEDYDDMGDVSIGQL